jgi:sugar phosphate isomerase/epimerase
MLYGVHAELARDFTGTLRAVAQMGYEGVEFWDPYFFWSAAYAKEVRSLLDDLHLPCLSTHNESLAFTPDGLSHAIELNKILGSPNIVAARGLVSAREPHHGFAGKGLDGWKRLAETLGEATERLQGLKMNCAFHNHAIEFEPFDGTRPIDVLAGVKDLGFHLDIGPCRSANTDPIGFIEQHPGRIHCVLASDWPRDARGIQPLVGKGQETWKQVFDAAEGKGGVRFYLIQQENSEAPPLEAIRQDLATFRRLHG